MDRRLSSSFGGLMKTPYYLIDEDLLVNNLKVLHHVKEKTGCKILLAQKCFSMFSVYPLIAEYLDGTTASGLFEAKLGYEKMHLENHVYSAAYRDDEIEEIMQICDHVVFNSFNQWQRYQPLAKKYQVSCGIRINPECSTQVGHEIYDPCAPFSRMGVTIDNFREDLLDGIDGLHFHTLCQQNSDDLVTTIKAVEAKFGPYLKKMKWLNFGGGHHITRDDYDKDTLINIINEIKNKYQVQVYLEPGEAVALNAGYLVTSVLDIIHNGIDIAIVDTSAACHMPDVLEMPYRPLIIDSDKPNIKPYTYRLGGPTCLAGDIIGDYSFDQPLQIGQQLWFEDMAIYSMVKNNTFNGMNLPSIVLKQGSKYQVIKSFGYEDFKQRLS